MENFRSEISDGRAERFEITYSLDSHVISLYTNGTSDPMATVKITTPSFTIQLYNPYCRKYEFSAHLNSLP